MQNLRNAVYLQLGLGLGQIFVIDPGLGWSQPFQQCKGFAADKWWMCMCDITYKLNFNAPDV